MKKVELELKDELYEKAVRGVETGEFTDINEFVCAAIKELADRHGKWLPKETSVYDTVKRRILRKIGSRYLKKRNYQN